MSHVNHFLTLPADLYAELREIAHLRGMSLSDFMLECLMKNSDAHLQMREAGKAFSASVSRYTSGIDSTEVRTERKLLH